mmetsp:Transcript_5780/g.19166  ORF Transcript_5780/g.19166 Transcript_5780/m.19166 type:complete len:262 (-) Transcript_5780:512-1297(-)
MVGRVAVCANRDQLVQYVLHGRPNPRLRHQRLRPPPGRCRDAAARLQGWRGRPVVLARALLALAGGGRLRFAGGAAAAAAQHVRLHRPRPRGQRRRRRQPRSLRDRRRGAELGYSRCHSPSSPRAPRSLCPRSDCLFRLAPVLVRQPDCLFRGGCANRHVLRVLGRMEWCAGRPGRPAAASGQPARAGAHAAAAVCRQGLQRRARLGPEGHPRRSGRGGSRPRARRPRAATAHAAVTPLWTLGLPPWLRVQHPRELGTARA